MNGSAALLLLAIALVAGGFALVVLKPEHFSDKAQHELDVLGFFKLKTGAGVLVIALGIFLGIQVARDARFGNRPVGASATPSVLATQTPAARTTLTPSSADPKSVAATATPVPASTPQERPTPRAQPGGADAAPTRTIPPQANTPTIAPVVAAPTPLPAPTPCADHLQLGFLWATTTFPSVATYLGCAPKDEQPLEGSYQPFQNGEMLFRNDTRKVTVFAFEQTFQDGGAVGTWKTESILGDREEAIPQSTMGLQDPVRGFRDVWSRNDYQHRLLQATKSECAFRQSFVANSRSEYGNGAIQEFPGGRLFYVPLEGRVIWIVIGAEPGPGTFLRVHDGSADADSRVTLVDFHPAGEPEQCVLRVRQSLAATGRP